MTFLRVVLPVGAIVFGAIAMFLGLTVVLMSIGRDTITVSHTAADGTPVVNTTDRNTDPAAYWKLIGLMGGLPLVIGTASVWWGRRSLHRQAARSE